MFRLALVTLLPAAISLHALGGDQGVDTRTVPQAAAEPEAPAPKEFARADALISAAALAKLIEKKDAALALIDARNAEPYLEGHILGARNIPSDALQDTARPPYLMPAPEVIQALCAEHGIHPDSRVVIYDDEDGRLAARVWFTLHAYGHEHVVILEGGLGKWRDGRRPWSAEQTLPPARRGTFEPAQTLRGVCSFEELAQFRPRVHVLGKMPTTTALDARSLKEYMGEDARAKLSGHIPGAANLEWSALLTGKERLRTWRSPPEIHAILRLAGVDREQKIAVYDQAGGRSAHLYFTLWLMGFEKAFNYVAGWREYGNKEAVEVEK